MTMVKMKMTVLYRGTDDGPCCWHFWRRKILLMLIWEGVLASLLTSWLLFVSVVLVAVWKFPQRSGIWGFGGMEKCWSHGENNGTAEKKKQELDNSR